MELVRITMFGALSRIHAYASSLLSLLWGWSRDVTVFENCIKFLKICDKLLVFLEDIKF